MIINFEIIFAGIVFACYQHHCENMLVQFEPLGLPGIFDKNK